MKGQLAAKNILIDPGKHGAHEHAELVLCGHDVTGLIELIVEPGRLIQGGDSGSALLGLRNRFESASNTASAASIPDFIAGVRAFLL